MSESYLVFTGRPNAGKSIIIRKITGLETRSGKHPGTTRRVLVYPLSQGLSLVDMPGYGRITGASRSQVEEVKDEIVDFIDSKGDEIVLAVHILDISTFMEVSSRMERKGFIPLDLEMIQYLEDSIGEPPLVVANKVDKLGKEKASILAELKYSIASIPSSVVDCIVFPVSAKTGEGLGDLKKKIHDKLIENGFKTPFKK